MSIKEADEDLGKDCPPPGPIIDLPARRIVLFLFTAAFVVGLPFWWITTTIERLTLPSNRVHAWTESRPCILKPTISIKVRSDDQDPFHDERISSVNQVLSAQLASLPGARCLDLVDYNTSHAYEIVLSTKTSAPILSGRTAVIPGDREPATLEQDVFLAASTLLDLDTLESGARAVKFAPRYKISISLLNGDATQPGSILEWDASRLVNRHIRPLLSSLAGAHQFDVETSIQYFAPLAIPVAQDAESGGTVVQESDLRAFVNNAEWNIPTSNTLDPVLHFMFYVPSAAKRPMRINANSVSNSSSFILPQRGGVIIVNLPSDDGQDISEALHNAFARCRWQLSRILGVPASTSPSIRATPEPWQIDAVHRKRLHEASKDSVDSLDAIIKLVAQLPNMRVGSEVKAGVIAALDQLDQAQIALAESVPASLDHASRSAVLASKAYFDPSMLALLYFPDEHKYAIYTPLFGPVMVPILVGLLREWREWKERRKKMREGVDKDKTE